MNGWSETHVERGGNFLFKFNIDTGFFSFNLHALIKNSLQKVSNWNIVFDDGKDMSASILFIFSIINLRTDLKEICFGMFWSD